MQIGQTFSIDLAVNYRNGNKGIDLRDSLSALILNFNIGSDMYAVNGAASGGGNLYADLADNELSPVEGPAMLAGATAAGKGAQAPSGSGSLT